MATEVAVLGGGCFWCLEAVYDQLKGVTSVESGYAGGHIDNPTYKQICTGTTGHAEVVRVSFDPAIVSFQDILNVFFTIHDPTTLNRQGADVGTQYRSVIFYQSPEQKTISEAVMREWTDKKVWQSPLVTELSPAPKFYIAEDYHQEYFVNNPYAGYCQVVVAPKVAKFRKYFMDRLKA
jgi:peptide-methionine (S)-S-oxide reductase